MAAIAAATIGAAGALGSSLLGSKQEEGPSIPEIRQQASRTKSKLIGGETFKAGGKTITIPGLNIRSGLSNVDAATGQVNIDPAVSVAVVEHARFLSLEDRIVHRFQTTVPPLVSLLETPVFDDVPTDHRYLASLLCTGARYRGQHYCQHGKSSASG